MLFSDTYHSIKQTSEGLFKDRGSKFFAYAYPVKTENEIKERLLELRKLHPTARHHCYAYRLGADKQNYRANDDGEPSNTAGKPILGQIQSFDLTNVLVVVVRYFGGTLLGVGGLINAYKLGAAEALKNAEIVEHYITFNYEVKFPSENMNDVLRILKDKDCKITAQDYTDTNIIHFAVRKNYMDEVESSLKAIHTCRVKAVV